MRAFRSALLSWYDAHARDLPWRRTRDPYRIWLSEIMLQQTRVAAVIPYYERFLERFPTVPALASAPEQEVLAAWAGLGYYSRARNLQKAARQVGNVFPSDYAAIRALPGIGEYTAAAIASIAFDLPHAVLDGNVMRVLARVNNDPGDLASPAARRRLQQSADALLDRRNPGRFNQALMELGATVCLPRDPRCLVCPVAAHCAARREGRQNELPVKLRKARAVEEMRTLWIVRNRGRFLLRQVDAGSKRLAGFWELPDALPGGKPGKLLGEFRHAIVNHRYLCRVQSGTLRRAPRGFQWVAAGNLQSIPLTTMARKALAIADRERIE
ncbi:MAG: A/G-specific adenine glycosylase [Bryobacteraceae bacterium]|nr:A/G-specific adenine glycosylase [Bryobacteraceae bacterium]